MKLCYWILSVPLGKTPCGTDKSVHFKITIPYVLSLLNCLNCLFRRVPFFPLALISRYFASGSSFVLCFMRAWIPRYLCSYQQLLYKSGQVYLRKRLWLPSSILHEIRMGFMQARSDSGKHLCEAKQGKLIKCSGWRRVRRWAEPGWQTPPLSSEDSSDGCSSVWRSRAAERLGKQLCTAESILLYVCKLHLLGGT